MEAQQENKWETAIFANGCFWCTEAVFQRVNGVKEVLSGYTGGTIKNPAYREVCSGRTGHAEAVKVIFDPQVVTYEALLELFFGTHDPTTLNRQGNDVGTQYRSGIFYTSEEQRLAAIDYIERLEKAKVFGNPIVTEVTTEHPFYPAEQEHHNYYNDHGSQPYCQMVIRPKIEKLNQHFGDKLVAKS
ncbi:MAG: peptide-methionine (S)-S-oxide reductase MsrA [Bacteroidota bacterium]